MADNVAARDFHHPYQPYEVQKEFMQAVYDCLEEGKVGILESPTGTGKSLSLICGSLTWLRDFNRRELEKGLTSISQNTDEPEWIIQHEQKEKRSAFLQQRAETEVRLARVRANEDKEVVQPSQRALKSKRQKTTSESNVNHNEDEDSQFAVKDYDSDNGSMENVKSLTDEEGVSTATKALINKLGERLPQTEEEIELSDELKIFFCSRTHSQLKQFVNELRRVKVPTAVTLNQSCLQSKVETLDRDLTTQVKHLSLGSRKNLCINPKVSKLKSTTAINERCLELQKPGTASESKCPYLPRGDNLSSVNEFRDHALARIRDIEDFANLGKKLNICPYYATRTAIKPSEIVTMPYPLLLQKSAREALGISLKGHIVVIDEAHNLADTIANLYSVTLSLRDLGQARRQLGGYLEKFRNRLKGKNRMYIGQLIRLIDSLTMYLVSKRWSKTDGAVQMSDLMWGKGCDQINLYKLTQYLVESKLAHKVEGYSTYLREKSVEEKRSQGSLYDTETQDFQTSSSALSQIQSFIFTLTYPANEGRFFHTIENSTSGEAVSLRYALLDPTEHFKSIVEEARAVILAGGTMSPMSDYTDHLLSYLGNEQIKTLSCGHVIPKSQLLAIPVTQGPDGKVFNFAYNSRNNADVIVDLGKAIHGACLKIPDGVVAFFPSYAYLSDVIKIWKTHKASYSQHTVWQALSSVKDVFQEPKSGNNNLGTTKDEATTADSSSKPDLDATLVSFSHSISKRKGGLLLAVIGGSLSEGINFSDSLGRGIIVVGLPYPNSSSSEWKAKLEFIEGKNRHKLAGKLAAQEFYQNTCMRAVNQSIGRAIRHKNDYATILLFDERYQRENIKQKLPSWIKDSLRPAMNFGQSVSEIGRFFIENQRSNES